MWNRNLLVGVVFFGSALMAPAQYGGDPYQAQINRMMQASSNLTLQMQMREQQIVQSTLNNPQAMAMYQQHRAQGGTMSPQQFAYQYAATGGFSPEGKRNLFDNDRRDTARIQQTWQGVQQTQAQSAAAIANWQNGYSNIQDERGKLLRGTSTYNYPNAGTSHVLPHNVPAGAVTYDRGTGQYFQIDNQGRYYVHNNGYWYPMNPR